MIEIPGYTVIREIGSGGMATVYLALQASLERRVALKVMAPALAADPAFSKRFLREARTIAQLTHPNIVPVYDVGVTKAGQHYFSMAYLPDGDFVRRIRRGVDEMELVRVIGGIVRALGFAHSHGYVHRDVTPGNILFDHSDTPVLTDFGIARAVSSSTRITGTGFAVGTSYYMSPEQARGGRVDARSDLYSLGIVVYEALVGQPPFTGADGFAIAYSHVFDAVPSLPERLSHWQDFIDRALAKEPDERFQEAKSFEEAMLLAASVTSGEIAAVGVGAPSIGKRADWPRALRDRWARGLAQARAAAATATTGLLRAGRAAWSWLRAHSRVDTVIARQALADTALLARRRLAAAGRWMAVTARDGIGKLTQARGGTTVATVAAGTAAVVVLIVGWSLLGTDAADAPPDVAMEAAETDAAAVGDGHSASNETGDAGAGDSGPAGRSDPAGKAGSAGESDGPAVAKASGDVDSGDGRGSPGDVTAGTDEPQTGTLGPVAMLEEDKRSRREPGKPPLSSRGASAAPLEGSPSLMPSLAWLPAPAPITPTAGADDDAGDEPSEARQGETRIERLVALGRADLEAMRLTLPPERNAFARFRAVLSLQPDHAGARSGLTAIVHRYIDLARDAAAGDDYDEAAELLDRAREVAGFAGTPTSAGQRLAAAREALGDRILERAEAALNARRGDLARRQLARSETLGADEARLRRDRRWLESEPMAGDTFRDTAANGEPGPELVVIPAVPDGEGGFDGAPFALARREVTVSAFRQFVEAGGFYDEDRRPPGCETAVTTSMPAQNWQDPGYPQAADHPVACVTWTAANAYAEWLSEATGERYRLPDGDAWRRAGAKLAPGTESACRYANIADRWLARKYPDRQVHDCDDGWLYTAPTGTFEAAPSGVHDLIGNVGEWLSDCAGRTEREDDADKDDEQAAKTSASCTSRWVAGGGWLASPEQARVTARRRLAVDGAVNTVGFRVLRALDALPSETER